MSVVEGIGGTRAGCILRKATLEDIPEIYRIELLCFPDPWEYKALFEMMAVYLTSFYIAESDGRVVGFSAGAIEETGDEMYGHVCNIAVSPDMRGMGIGRLLLRKLERDFFVAGCTACSLEVRKSNAGAHAFYERIGYEDVIVFGEYYKDGEDAQVMMRWF